MGTESSTLAGGEAPAEAAAPPAAAEEEQQPEPAAAPALVALEEENQQPAEAAAPEPPLPEPVVAGASKGPAPVRKDPSKSAVVPPAPVLNAASLLGGPSSLPTSGLTPKLGEGLTDSPAAWDQMEASMMALQSALMMEEDARKKLMPVARAVVPPSPVQTAPALPDESLEARLAQLSAAIEGDDALAALAAAEDAARNEARARRIKEREAKREAKRQEKAAKEAAEASAPGRVVAPVLPVVVEKKIVVLDEKHEARDVTVQLAPSMAAKLAWEKEEQLAEERERQRLKEEWAEREAKMEAEEAAKRAEAEEKERARQAAEEERSRRKMEEAAAEAAAISDRERTEPGSAQNIALATTAAEVVRQLLATAARSSSNERLITMIQEDVPELVCDCLTKYPNDLEVQKAGCAALKALSAGEDRTKMRGFCERGMDCVCAALEAHGSDGDFQLAAFGALGGLAVHISNKVAVVHVVLAGLAADPSNEALAEVACSAIKNAALGDDSNRVAAAEAGALEALQEAMRAHPTVPAVQEQACWAIKNLSVNAANQARFGEMGMVQDVLTAMRALPRFPPVQEQACWALRILSFRPENNAAVAAEGGVTAVIDAMKMHLSHAGVQETCCGALRTLSVIPESKIEVIEKGALVRVVAAMRAHAKRSSVQIAATGLLSALVTNPDMQRRAASAGVIEAIVEVLTVHRKNPKVQQACFSVLSNMTAANSENKNRCARAGAVEAAVNALHTHANLTPLCEVCCETLASIVSNEDSQIAALDARGIEAIVNACRAHPHRPNLQEKGCKAMSSIAWCQPPAQRRARDAGVLKDILAMLNTFRDHRGVQKQARALMQTIQVEEDDDDDDRPSGSNREAAVVGLTVRQPNYRYHTL